MSKARAAAAKPPSSTTRWNTRMDKSLSMAAIKKSNFHDCFILRNAQLLTQGFLI
jgi:hypothetical protein